jgi:restriction endonuclease Mrr
MEPKKKDESARFVRYFGPLLDALRALGGSGTPDEVVESIALDLGLSDEVQNELTPSGKARYRNQVAWARFYLVTEGLLDSSKHGVWSLTERGRSTRYRRNKHEKSSGNGFIFSKNNVAGSLTLRSQALRRWPKKQRQQMTSKTN